jgi:hypothetical protein
MRALLLEANPSVYVQMGGYTPEDALSERQLLQFLPDREYIPLTSQSLENVTLSGDYDAIITSRVYRPLSLILKKTISKNALNRSKIISFLGGLDFFPEKGIAHRKSCDGVFLFPQKTLQDFKSLRRKSGKHAVGFGHPSFLRPTVGAKPKGNDIYFFAQAISPNTKRARLHVLNAVCAIARRNPNRQVWIKLRHLPDENAAHKHREKFNYATLMSGIPDIPHNVGVTACTMAEATKSAGLGITCTSTAAIDLIHKSIPTMVYLDYVDNYCDDLAAPMRKLFANSGLITSLDDMLNLRPAEPNPDWVNDLFCPQDLGAQVLQMIEELNA